MTHSSRDADQILRELGEEPLFLRSLTQDVEDIEQMLLGGDSAVLRRALFRAVFAEIEGYVYRLEDRAKLRSELLPDEYSAQDKERLFSTAPKRSKDVAKDALQLLSGKTGRPPDLGGVGWKSLDLARQKRNRLMHPATATDLDVTAADLKNLRMAREWFHDHLEKQTQAAIVAMKVLAETVAALLRDASRSHEQSDGASPPHAVSETYTATDKEG